MDRRYDVVTFDMGFTLVYFYPSWLELGLRAFREAGVMVSAERLVEAWQAMDREFYQDIATATFEPSEEGDNARELEYRRQLLLRLGFHSEEMLHKLRETEIAVYAEPGAMRLYPEVRAVLDRLHAEGYRLGIISNWSWNLRKRCQQVGITNDFEVILASAYAGCYKPNPTIFRLALERLQASPSRAIHVGDDYRADVLGAQGAGMDAVLVERDGASLRRGVIKPAPTTYVIRGLEELFPILENASAR